MHGEQLDWHFSGFCDGYYFLPLYAFCGQLLVSYLRPAYRDAAHHDGAILALLVRRLGRVYLKRTMHATAQVTTLRLKLLKIGIHKCWARSIPT